MSGTVLYLSLLQTRSLNFRHLYLNRLIQYQFAFFQMSGSLEKGIRGGNEREILDQSQPKLLTMSKTSDFHILKPKRLSDP